ncbi:MAG TPA: cysteine desulfurase family protein [Myxococcota bacterium]|nr:cysteine desulfurase family protein [Myxococcota bacterium]
MRIYLDHNATTPVRAEVADAMSRALRDLPGNPSSVHAEGAAARAAVEAARERVATLVGAASGDVVFTSGATEANHAALHAAVASAGPAAALVTSTAEHPSVEEAAAALEERGHRVTRVGVDAEGRLELDGLEAALARGPALASLLLANNETGVVQDADALAARAQARGVPLHLDATQAVGKVPVDVARLGASFLSASAHKFGGPKGAGFLVCRGRPLPPWLHGGPQERGRRGGTENVPGIVGLGVACELALRELGERAACYAALRDRLWAGIREKVPRVRWNGGAGAVLPNTLSVEFEGADGEALLQALDLEGVAVSMGAACHSGSITPSRVLAAMGRSPAQARATLRWSIGHGVDESQIDRVLALLPDLVARAREAAA